MSKEETGEGTCRRVLLTRRTGQLGGAIGGVHVTLQVANWLALEKGGGEARQLA